MVAPPKWSVYNRKSRVPYFRKPRYGTPRSMAIINSPNHLRFPSENWRTWWISTNLLSRFSLPQVLLEILPVCPWLSLYISPLSPFYCSFRNFLLRHCCDHVATLLYVLLKGFGCVAVSPGLVLSKFVRCFCWIIVFFVPRPNSSWHLIEMIWNRCLKDSKWIP